MGWILIPLAYEEGWRDRHGRGDEGRTHSQAIEPALRYDCTTATRGGLLTWPPPHRRRAVLTDDEIRAATLMSAVLECRERAATTQDSLQVGGDDE